MASRVLHRRELMGRGAGWSRKVPVTFAQRSIGDHVAIDDTLFFLRQIEILP